MFRMWCKIWKDNRMIKDTVIERPEEDTRTHKVFHALKRVAMSSTWNNPYGWIRW